MKVELTNGGWATFRDPAAVTNRERKKVTAVWESAEGGEIQQGMAGIAAVVALLVTEWSFDKPLPSVDPESLDDLVIGDYDALFAAGTAAMADLFPNFKGTMADLKDPKASPDGSTD